MDAFGNPIMFNSFPNFNYSNMPEQPMIVMPIYLDDPNNPCNSLSNYGAPIKLQSYYPTSPYQQYQQAAAAQQQQQQPPAPSAQPQYSTAPVYQTQAAPQPPPISPPGYWPQTSQPIATQAPPPPPTETPPIVAAAPTTTAPIAPPAHQTSLMCTCTDVSHLPYCPDSIPYCPDTGIYCSTPPTQYRQPPPPQYKQPCPSSHIKPVRLPTIYKNLYEPPRKGDELIAEYEEVLCHERRPRVYSRQRCQSSRRHQSRGHEVLAEYTEVLDYRPRNYSRGRRSNDDWSDYDDYDSHYDQRSCDLYYDRSYDRSFDRSYEHSHSYDMYHENRRSSRRARSPGPYYYHPQKGYPNEQPPNVNIEAKSNPKSSRQMHNGTPVQQKSDIYKTPEFKQQPPPPPPPQEYNDYRNARSPVSSHPPPRNLRTPRNPPPNYHH